MYKVTIIGNVVAEPTIVNREWTDKNTGEIIRADVCNFSVGANQGYGENRKTQYFRVHAWRGLAKICGSKLTKGTKVYIEGLPGVNSFVNKNKEFRAELEVRADQIDVLEGGKRIVITEDKVEEMDETFDDVPY